MIRLNRRAALSAGAGLGWLSIPRPAEANGDAFFKMDLFDAAMAKNVFLGSVKDDEGNYVEDAVITVHVQVPEEYGGDALTFNAYTNVIGRYRTLDTAAAVAALLELEIPVEEIKLDFSKVELTAEKKGYAMKRRLRRGRAAQSDGPFEIDFVLARTDADASRPGSGFAWALGAAAVTAAAAVMRLGGRRQNV